MYFLIMEKVVMALAFLFGFIIIFFSVSFFVTASSDNLPKIHVAFLDDDLGNDLEYCNNTAGSWSCVSTADSIGPCAFASGTIGDYPSIALNSTNGTYISNYESFSQIPNTCYKTQVGIWQSDSPEEPLIGVANLGKYTSIAIGSNDKTHFSHYDTTNGNLRYCNNTAGLWSCATVDTANNVGQYTSLGLDSNNKAHISHYDTTNGNLRYCNNTAGSWSCVAIEGMGSSGSDTSIAIDSNNKAHVYHDNQTLGSGAIRYCNNTAGLWSCATVEASFELTHGSIAIDSNNKAHLVTGPLNSIRYCNNTAGSWSCMDIASRGSALDYFMKPSLFIQGMASRSNVNPNSGDATSPVVTIINPTNKTYNAANFPLVFNVTLSENGSVIYTLDNYFHNYTMNGNQSGSYNSLFGTAFNGTNSSMSDGSYVFKVWANDSAGNINNTANVTFSVDRTNPNVTINLPTSATKTVSNFNINITLSESGACVYSLDSGLNNNSLTNNGNVNFNSTNSSIANGDYTFNAYCNDSIGNKNYSERMSFSISVSSGSEDTGGGGGSPGGQACVSEYSCSSWSSCTQGTRERTCVDVECGKKNKIEQDSCSLILCVPNWECGSWGSCINGMSTRTCTDLNSCGNELSKPLEELKCNELSDNVECIPNIECGEYGGCNYNDRTENIFKGEISYTGIKGRECLDLNSCVSDYSENVECVNEFEIELVEEEICGVKTLTAVNKESKNPVTFIDLDEWSKNRLNIKFVQSKSTCLSCFNRIMDGNETGIDCGSECGECIYEQSVDLSFTKWPLWILLIILLIITLIYSQINNEKEMLMKIEELVKSQEFYRNQVRK